MRKRVAYYVSCHWLEHTKDEDHPVKKHDCSQYLLPNELYLIKTMINNGSIITGIEKHELFEREYKTLFGK